MASLDLDQIEALLEAPLNKGPESESKDQNEEKKSDSNDKGHRKRSRSRSRSRDRKRRHSRSRSPRDKKRRSRSRSKERKHRSGSRDRRTSKERERDREKEKLRERERRDNERQKERDKEALLDPLEREAIQYDRDVRTVFVTNLPIKAYEDEIEKWFTERAGKVRDVRLISDKNSRRSKGVGYVEFFDKSSVPAALTLSGHIFMGQTISVQPTQSEKNRTQGSLTTTYFGPTRLYAGSLPFHVTEEELKEIFGRYPVLPNFAYDRIFGQLELVDIHKDPETGRSKGFAFIQFKKSEDAKRALSKTNGMEIGGRAIKVGFVNDPLAGKRGDLDDEDAQLVPLNGAARAMLMAKLEKAAAPPGAQAPKEEAPKVISSPCILLKNMFDPAEETSPNWPEEIKEDVCQECKRFGSILHCYIDQNSSGHVYIKFGSVPGAQNAINHLNGRWFSKKQIVASFVPEGQYYSKFPEAMSK